MQTVLKSSLIALALVASGATMAHAKKAQPVEEDGLPSLAEVTTKAREVYQDLEGNSDPSVRRVVFEGLLALDKSDITKAITVGVKDSDWTIREPALALALKSRDKKIRAGAEKTLSGLLESADEADRTHGMALLAAKKNKAQMKALWRAAKDGSPDARAAARAEIIKRGGKSAWKVISAGLAEAPTEREYKEAVVAIEALKSPIAVKWALKTLQSEGDLGAIARDYLVRVTDGKVSKKLDKDLRKSYEKSADFETRIRFANVIARRGGTETVSRTLRAGLRYQKPWARELAWQGLEGLRDLATLGKLREKILSNEVETEADLAFAWLTAWAKENGEGKVYEVLQEAARGDRRSLRMRGMKALATLKHRKSAPIFEGAMTEGQTEVRVAAAKGLAAVARAGDEKRLAKFLRKEPAVSVKKALIDGLANIGTPAIIDSLQFIVTAREKELKLAAALAVAATQKPKAISLLSLLKRDADLDVRFAAWKGLLKLKPSMQKELERATGWLTGSHIEELGKDPAIEASILETIARKGNDTQRTFAVDALKARGKTGVTRLLGLVESPHADTAALSLEALAKQRKGSSIATYRKALKSTHGIVRAMGFSALGDYGRKALLETVLTGLADKEPIARAHAAAAAVKLAGRDD